MAAYANVGLMIMYEDESVDVRYGDGSRLFLSPCGSEFVLVKPPDPSAHPLQPCERVRQRTRFTVSAYKELMVDALIFRNKYATRPYLPEEIIAADHKKPFYSNDSQVEWPKLSSSDAELGPSGETIIRSVKGKAALLLSSSGAEFLVEFNCDLSQAQNRYQRAHSLSGDTGEQLSNATRQRSVAGCPQTTDDERKQTVVRGKGRRGLSRSQSCSPQNNNPSTAQSKVYLSTIVVQHHSCSCVDPMWLYPLSLARHHWTIRHSKPPGDTEAEGARDPSHAYGGINTTEVSSEERRSRLPEALPLTCTSPHRHRWRTVTPLVQGEQYIDQDLPRELVKVMWCDGVIYRILNGAMPVVEVSPGDGSVIRSNGTLNSYFTHHRNEPRLGEVKEVTYHLKSLPPDVPGQVMSVGSVLSRASRLLTCYNNARHSLKLPVTPSCLEQGILFSESVTCEEQVPDSALKDHQNMVTQTVHISPNVVAAELEKIRQFSLLLDGKSLLRKEENAPKLGCSSAQQEPVTDPLSDSCVTEALQKTSKAIQDIDNLISAIKIT
ncbi:uncharacterized protein C5orf34 homolog [Lampris incognitus]|uniref:uncharacterized protein C5orf34 homolog n=1 Tax=Lampris incognitus TaxID=2546036 RepID=UPI0024B4FDB9|nr:uncharacterized protein C5orf34 homolog [Lampris incognitus]